MVGGVQELVGVGGSPCGGSVCGRVVPRAGRREHGVEGVLAFLAIWGSPGSEVDGGGGPEFEHVVVQDVCDEPLSTAGTGE